MSIYVIFLIYVYKAKYFISINCFDSMLRGIFITYFNNIAF
jgi:hypothetical protein